jgi:hypothetical protein
MVNKAAHYNAHSLESVGITFGKATQAVFLLPHSKVSIIAPPTL